MGEGQPRTLFWVLTILSVAAYSVVELPCADTWWHLAAGRELWEQGRFLTSDPFSFTTSGQFWFNHEWLAELLFYLSSQFGGLWGVLGLRTLLVVLAFGVIPALAHRRRSTTVAFMPLLLLIVGQAYFFLDARAYLFTYTFLSLTLLALRKWLESKSARWLILGVLLMIPWSNCHGGYILGPVVWSIAGVGLFWKSRREGLILLATGFLCMLAALINPYGLHIWVFPFSLHQHPLYLAHLNEWQAPILLGPGFLYLLLPVLGGWLLSRESALAWEWLLFLAFLLLGFTTWRHGVLAGLVATHMLSHRIPEVEESLDEGLPIYLFRACCVAVALLLLAQRLPGGPKRWSQLESHFPVQAAEFLRDHPELPDRVMNPYEWGGYLAWSLGPRVKTFIDGRAHTLYSDQVYADFLAFSFGIKSTQGVQTRTPAEVIEQYDIPMVLVTRLHTQTYPMLSRAPSWSAIYEDKKSAVFLRLDEQTLQQVAQEIDSSEIALRYADRLKEKPEAAAVFIHRADELRPESSD